MSASFIPSYTCPDRNRRVLLVRRPEGIPQAEDFAFDESAPPVPGEGQFVVRNLYLSVDPAQRGWASSVANYSQPVALGTPMRALAVGVIQASRHSEFAAGEFVYGWFDWQDYALAGPEQVLTHIAAPRAPLSAYAGVLGLNGVTAYLAFNDLGRPKAGDTVLVSTAAGAVGSVVGQIARAAGCRAIGLTGADDKVAQCTAKFGYDAALNYKTGDIAAWLRDTAPDGLNIFFDNTGGSILDTALRAMSIGGRVIQCGTASVSSWMPVPQGPRNEREVLTRRLIWSGFVIFDYLAQFGGALAALETLVHAGQLQYDEDIEQGLAGAPTAIGRIYAGENRGKKLMFVG